MRRDLFLLSLLAMLFFGSCAVSSNIASKETYRSDTFTPRVLDAEGFAILPITAGSGVEGYRRPFGDAINAAAADHFKNAIPWNETMGRLNDEGLVDEYQRAIQAYKETAIINKEITSRLCSAMDVRYLLFINLAPPERTRELKYSVLSGSSYTSESQAIFAYAKIWDAEGDIAWEGASSASAQSGAYSYIKDSVEDQCKQVADALVRRMRELPPATATSQ